MTLLFKNGEMFRLSSTLNAKSKKKKAHFILNMLTATVNASGFHSMRCALSYLLTATSGEGEGKKGRGCRELH